MRLNILPVLLLFSFTFSYSQPIVIDSLKHELKKAEKAKKIPLLNQLARLSLATSLDEAEDYSTQALNLSDSENEDKALTYHNLGLVYYFRGIPDSAIKFYNLSIIINQRFANHSQLSKTFNNLGAIYNETGLNDSSIVYFNRSLKHSRLAADSASVAMAMGNLSNVFLTKGEFAKSLALNESALRIYQAIGDSARFAQIYVNIGLVFKNLGDYPNALKMYLAALKIHEMGDNRREIGAVYYSIGNIYYDWNQFEQAKQYFSKSLTLFQETNHLLGMGYAYNQLGNILIEGDSDEALKHFQSALKIFEDISDPNGVANVNSDMAIFWWKKKQPLESMIFINQAIETYNEIGSRQGVAKSLIIRAKIKLMLRDRMGAKEDLKHSFEYALLMNSKKLKLENLMLLSSIYKEENDYWKAYDLYEKANVLKDSIFNEERSRQIDEYSILYETQKKEKEIIQQKADIERKNADLRQQKILSRALIGGIVVLAIFAGLIVLAYIQKRKINLKILQQKQEIEGKNRQLDMRNEEIETQRDLLFKQNQEITENIEYAKRIQTALFPSDEILDKHLKEHFVLFLPRNIVSGDFYWVKTVEQYTLVVVADCTGHGISGAFMSILGISLLNEVVKEGVIDSAVLLKRLRASIKTTLRQTNSPDGTRDGMDMSLCIIDRNKKKLCYSGAFIPLIVIKRDEIFEYIPDKMPIGIFPMEKENFTNHTIDLDGTECIYMFSDGFYDQFGGANFKKFKRENLQLALLENHRLPMDKQREILLQRFEEWRGENHQFDDVLVMGFRVSGLI